MGGASIAAPATGEVCLWIGGTEVRCAYDDVGHGAGRR